MKTILSTCLILLSFCALAQQELKVDGLAVSAKSARQLIKQGKVYYLNAGMPVRGLSDAAKQCKETVQKEFGFSYYSVGGDVTDAKKTKQINAFNEVVRKHLASKYGADWEKKLNAKLEDCNKK
jgi:hypothetical protein